MKMNVILIVIGSLLLIAGIVMTVSQNNKEDQKVVKFEKHKEKPFEYPETTQINLQENTYKSEEHPRSNTDKEPSSETLPIVENGNTKQKNNNQLDPKEIGNDFEGFVADVLKANGIRLKEWNQGTTSPEGAYAENELNPDFRVIQKSDRGSLEYWIECKYRARLHREGFKLEDYQQNRYESIQGKSKRKVLIALGVGGSPKAPADFYIIPLDTLLRFKRVGHKFLPHYAVENPRVNLKLHVGDWFYNDVFKNKN